MEVKLICPEHKEEIKHICIHPDCDGQNRLACIECFASRTIQYYQREKLTNFIKKLEQTKQTLLVIQNNNQNKAKEVEIAKIQATLAEIRKQINERISKIEQECYDYLKKIQFKIHDNLLNKEQFQLLESVLQNPQSLFQVSMQRDQIMILRDFFESTQSYQIEADSQIGQQINQKVEELSQIISVFLKERLSPLKSMGFIKIHKKFEMDSFGGKMLTSFPTQGNVSNLIALTETHYISAESNDTLKVWELGKDQPISQLKDQGPSAYWALLRLDEQLIAAGSCGKECSIKIFNWQQQKCIKTLKGHTSYVRCIIMLDQYKIISSSDDKSLKIWGWQEEKLLGDIPNAHDNCIWSIVILDNDKMASASEDKRIKIWRIYDWLNIKTIQMEAPQDSILRINQSFFATGGFDGFIRIIRISDYQVIKSIEAHLQGHMWGLMWIDENSIATGSYNDKNIKIWDWEVDKCEITLQGNSRIYCGMAVLNSEVLVTGGYQENQITIWK